MPNIRQNAVPAPSVTYTPEVRHFSIGSSWLYEGECRLDATAYGSEALGYLETAKNWPPGTVTVKAASKDVFYPNRFKRAYADEAHGVPFLSASETFHFRRLKRRYLKKESSDVCRIEPNWILVSRSGSLGRLALGTKNLSEFALSDDLIRITPSHFPIGYLYAFLASTAGQAMLLRPAYGSAVDHLEPHHIESIPVLRLGHSIEKGIHRKILRAYSFRDEANILLDQADEQLHALLGISPFSDRDIEYLGASDKPRAFSISSQDLGERFDATNHVPIVRSAIHKLKKGHFELIELGQRCSEIRIPARFKRQYVLLDNGVPYLLPSHIVTMRPYGMKSLSYDQAQRSPEYLLEEGNLLLTTDGTVGRVHPVTKRMVGWFGSNNMARLSDRKTDMGFLYSFLSTPFGKHQVRREIYGGVVDHIEESQISSVMMPDVPPNEQKPIGDLVRKAFEKKDAANELEEQAITEFESAVS